MSDQLDYVANYTFADQSLKDDAQTEFRNYYAYRNDATFGKDPTSDIDSLTFPAHTQDQLANIESKFAELQSIYKKQTEEMQTVNALANVGNFMENTMKSEHEKMSKLRDKTFSNVHKMRHHFMMLKYDINYNRFVSGIIQFTMFTFILCGTLYAFTIKENPPITETVALWVIGLIMTIYILIIFIIIRRFMSRRKDDWDKYYFQSMKK